MNRFLVASLVIVIVAGCGSSGSTAPPSPATTPFPTGAFAALADDPVPEDVAARFQAILDGMAGDGGITATVMTADGTWSGAAGTADGVDDMQPEP